MSLLQETHNQYASFSNTASCGDLTVAGTLFAASVVADALQCPAISVTGVLATSIETAALQVTTTPSLGAVLTSDATGNASWQPVPAPTPGPSAYGYAVGQNLSGTPAGLLVDFDLGTVVNNTGFTSVPLPLGTTFVIATAGVYEYNFYIAASNAAATTLPVEIGLVVNGAGAVAPNIFRSALGGADVDPMVCIGSGLVTLAAADTVTLQNLTDGGGTDITYTQLASPGSVAGANRTLSLKLISAA